MPLVFYVAVAKENLLTEEDQQRCLIIIFSYINKLSTKYRMNYPYYIELILVNGYFVSSLQIDY